MPGSGCLALGRGLSPPAWGGGAAWGCFWEKSALMWGGCLLQADFGALFPLCFFSPLCFYLQERAPRALQLPAGAHWCGTWGSLLSLDLCPVSVCSSSLGGKPLPFHFPSMFPFPGWREKPPWAGGQSGSAAVAAAMLQGVSASPGCPCPASGSLGDSQSIRRPCVCAPLAGGAVHKQTRCARGGWRAAARARCGLGEQMCWSYDVQLSNPCLGTAVSSWL